MFKKQYFTSYNSIWSAYTFFYEHDLPLVTFTTCLKVTESLPWKHKAIIHSYNIPKLLKHKINYKHIILLI